MSLYSQISKFTSLTGLSLALRIYAALGTLGLKSGKLAVWKVSSSIAQVKKMKRFLFYLATLSADSVVANSHNEANIRRKQLLIVGRIAYPKNVVNLFKGLGLFLSRNNWLPMVVWANRNNRLREGDTRWYYREVAEAFFGFMESFFPLAPAKKVFTLCNFSDCTDL